MVLLITIVFNFFLARMFIFLVLLQEIFFRSKKISFGVRLFLYRENFTFGIRLFFFGVRLFLSPRDFFSSVRLFSFPARMFLSKRKISGKPYKKDLAGYVDYG